MSNPTLNWQLKNLTRLLADRWNRNCVNWNVIGMHGGTYKSMPRYLQFTPLNSDNIELILKINQN